MGFVDGASNVLFADGLDRVVDDDFQDFGLSTERKENDRDKADDQAQLRVSCDRRGLHRSFALLRMTMPLLSLYLAGPA